MYIARKMPRTAEAVERERESNSLENIIMNIEKKGNISLPCGYYDTG